MGKYVTFKREDLIKILKNHGAFTESLMLMDDLKDNEIDDAVIIRRQDKFASPCLLTYAAMISMVAKEHPNIVVSQELLAIADYFHHQGVLAGEEGWKLPTL